MYLEFKSIEFKNFLSYGNTPQKIEFNHGMNLIVGKNGSGKSACLLDTLTFVLFGKPYRKIKISELINRTNKKNMYCKCEFVINGVEEYIIERGLKPDLLKIYKNGEEMELLSSKKLIQDEIEKIIGVTYNIFKLVIVLAVNHNKPYLAMDLAEKRDVIETIFNIGVFSDMLKSIKQDISNKKIEKDVQENSNAVQYKNVKDAGDQLFLFKKKQEEYKNNNEIKIKKIEEEVDVLKAKKEEKNNEYNLLNKNNNKEKEEEIRAKRKECDDKIRKIDNKIYLNDNSIKKIKKDSKFYVDNVNCPTCGTELDKENRNSIIEESNKNIVELEHKNEKLKEYKNKNSNVLDKLDRKLLEFQRFNRELIEKRNEISLIEKDILYKLDSINNIKNQESFDSQIKSFEDKYNESLKEYNTSQEILSKIEKNLSILMNSKNILSDGGIKAYVFDKLLPILNKRINDYLKQFELPIYIEITKNLTEEIINVKRVDSKISYFSHSEGEKKRIDISIVLSFIDILKLISNFKTNLIIFDELLEGQVDEEGLDQILDSIKNISDTNDEMCMYMISHRFQNYIGFNKQLTIKNEGSFSFIEKE